MEAWTQENRLEGLAKSANAERFIVSWLEKDPIVSPKRLRVLFTSYLADETVCEKTIRRMFRRRGYSGRAAAKKLTEYNIRRKRMEWFRPHRN